MLVFKRLKGGLAGDIQPNCDRLRFRLEKIYAIILSVNSVCARVSDPSLFLDNREEVSVK